MKLRRHKIRDFIIPGRFYYNHKVYSLRGVPSKYFIKGFEIKTINDKIDTIILTSEHPNVNPNTGEFCIPSYLRNKKLTEKNRRLILYLVSCFYLDDAYFMPYDCLKNHKEVLEHL